MDRLAVFVEGYTESVFVERLFEEIAGKNNVLIEKREIRGGTTVRRTMRRVEAVKPQSGQKYYVLILDCGGDKAVKSRILEEHENFTQQGYRKIIGIRDVRPDFSHQDIPKLYASLSRYKIRTSLIPVEFILAIMEIEAWFLAESSHFPKIDPSITLNKIKAVLGFDPENDDMEARLAPAEDLNNCYLIGGKAYLKHLARDTVNVLDIAKMYLDFPCKFSYFGKLVKSIEDFLN
jgi:hypothetical protein